MEQIAQDVVSLESAIIFEYLAIYYL